MKNFNIVGVYWKIRFQRGSHEKPIYRGELPKKGGRACIVCRFKEGVWWKRSGGFFEERGWYPNPHCAVKIGKVMFRMETNLIYLVIFYWSFLFVCKNMQSLKAAWITSYIFLVLLFDYKLHGLVKWYQKALTPVNKITEETTSKFNLV